MRLSSNQFHMQAMSMIQTAVYGAREQGLDISTMPPCFSVVLGKSTNPEYPAMTITATQPEILQDIDPLSWSWIVRDHMQKQSDCIGFIFWCIVQSEGTDSIFGFSYQKEGDSKAFLSNEDLSDISLVDPYDVVPYLNDDYEQEMVVH